MAVGAWLAAKEKGREKSILFLGIDGNPGPEGGCQAVLDGRLAATFLYPTPGAHALDLAVEMLRGGPKPPKEILLPTVVITPENARELVSR
jgi:ribose transport system substrate-binding protein